ncbi:MAG: YcxB family protein [Alcaligenaceae bacterium]|nr:YcxB family protein [Alcaligenaceae bacterium]
MINIKGKIRFDEYLAYNKFITRKRNLITNCIILALGVLLLWENWSNDFIYSQFIIPLALLYILYPLIGSRLLFRHRTKKHWERHPALRKAHEMNLLDDGVESIDDKGHPAHLNWEYFIDFKENQTIFMLFMSPTLAILIPKRLLKHDAEINQVRALCLEKIKPYNK